MKYLLVVVVFILFLFAYFNNYHAFGQSEFTVDTLLPNDVTSITYNSDDGNIYAALMNNRIAVINSTTNNVTDIIKDLEIDPSEISYDHVNQALYLFGVPITVLKSNISKYVHQTLILQVL